MASGKAADHPLFEASHWTTLLAPSEGLDAYLKIHDLSLHMTSFLRDTQCCAFKQPICVDTQRGPAVVLTARARRVRSRVRRWPADLLSAIALHQANNPGYIQPRAFTSVSELLARHSNVRQDQVQ